VVAQKKVVCPKIRKKRNTRKRGDSIRRANPRRASGTFTQGGNRSKQRDNDLCKRELQKKQRGGAMGKLEKKQLKTECSSVKVVVGMRQKRRGGERRVHKKQFRAAS